MGHNMLLYCEKWAACCYIVNNGAQHVVMWIQKGSKDNVTVVSEQIETTNSADNVTVVSEKIEIQRATRSDVDWNKKVDEFFLRMIKHPDFADSDDSCDTSVDTLGQRYSISESDTDIGSEYSSDLIKVKQMDFKVSSQTVVSSKGTISSELKSEKVKIKYKFSNSREAITYTLLKDYRPLSVFSVQFTWLGIHKIYRIGLVACSTYITDPWSRICTMTMVLLVMSVATAFVKPYDSRITNKVAFLSYIANICIAFVSVWKTGLATYGCTTNCGSHRDMAIFYMGMVEDVLLSYIPAVVVPVALLAKAVQKCRGKIKKCRSKKKE